MAVIRDYTCADLLAKAGEVARERRHGYVGIAHLFLAALKLPDSFTKEWARGASVSDFVLSAELCEQMPVWRLGDPREPVLTAKAAALVERLGPAAGEKSVIGWILGDDLNDASLHLLRRGIDASRYLDPDRGRDAAVVGAGDARSFEHLGRLNDFCRNLTLLAMSGSLHPVIGREAEIQKMRRILLQTMKNAPVLVGEAGVGKTAVVEGFARHLLERESHPVLKRLVVLELNLTALMSGTKYVGEMEKRIQLILRTVEDDPNVVLFIDELHRIVGLALPGMGAGRDRPGHGRGPRLPPRSRTRRRRPGRHDGLRGVLLPAREGGVLPRAVPPHGGAVRG